MVEITVKLKVHANNINEAELWLEELADNELFKFEIIKTEVI